MAAGSTFHPWQVIVETKKEEMDLAPACQSTEGQRDLKTPINIYFLETAYTTVNAQKLHEKKGDIDSDLAGEY